MAVGDCYMIDWEQVYGSQAIHTVWFYRSVSADADAQDIAESFEAQVKDVISLTQSSGVVHVALHVRNLFSLTDFYDLALTGAGGYAGDDLPVFCAYGFTLHRASAVTRNGSKRIPGVIEAVQTDGVVTDASQITALDGWADAILATLVDVATSLVNYAVPIIVKRIFVDDPDGDYYRLPDDLGEFQYSDISDVDWSPTITTQNSRKVGNGE